MPRHPQRGGPRLHVLLLVRALALVRALVLVLAHIGPSPLVAVL